MDCLGAAMATVSSRPPHQFAHGVACAQLVLPLQQTSAFGGKGVSGGSCVWKPRGGPSVSGKHRVIVMATQDAGTSTLVVQEVEFIWKGPGSTVLVSGDFVKWETQVPLEKTGSDGWFVVKQKLSPGTYKYKYIVDGEWKHSPDSPAVSDNAGGFNNEITIAGDKSSTQSTSKEGAAQAEDAVQPPPAPKEADPKPTDKPKAAATKETDPKPSDKPKAAASPPKPKVAAAGGSKKAAKAVAKPLPEAMAEDIVPQLTAYFEKENGISDVEIKFVDNQLEGSFVKNQVPCNFWAFFPDGKFEGSRGFSVTSHGSPPSTVEPFLIDENKISSELVVQQVIKRLFAQRLLGTN